MKPNHKRSHMMSASFVRHQKAPARCVSVISPFLRNLNMGTLAFIMFVGFALLSTTRGKEAETRQLAPVETTKSEIIIDKQHDNVPNVVTKAAGQTMSPPLTLWQFMVRIIDAFKGAFNDPSLIEYANQLGIGIADSPTAPLPDTSGQPLAPSKSPSSQPCRSSSNY
jgi:hypothetical protein